MAAEEVTISEDEDDDLIPSDLAHPDGNTFANRGTQAVLVRNARAETIKAKVSGVGECSQNQAHQRVVVVEQNGDKRINVLDTYVYNDRATRQVLIEWTDANDAPLPNDHADGIHIASLTLKVFTVA